MVRMMRSLFFYARSFCFVFVEEYDRSHTCSKTCHRVAHNLFSFVCPSSSVTNLPCFEQLFNSSVCRQKEEVGETELITGSLGFSSHSYCTTITWTQDLIDRRVEHQIVAHTGEIPLFCC